MSLLYRAIWQGTTDKENSDILNVAKNRTSRWIYNSDNPKPLDESSTPFSNSSGGIRSYTYREVDDCAFEVQVFDKSNDGTEWTTSIRVLRSAESISILIENGMESEDLAKRIKVGRPGIVHDLLGVFNKPYLGGSGINTGPLEIPENGISILVDLLNDTSRTLPVIVCTSPNKDPNRYWISRANQIAKRVEGVAIVVTLDNKAVTEFRSRLGDLAAWGGQIRIYATGPVDANADAWKHRYYTASQIEKSHKRVIDKIVYSTTQLSTRRRVPPIFDVFNSNEIEISQEKIEDERAEWDLALEIAREEQGDLERELARATGHLSRIKDELLQRGLGEIIWGTQQEADTSAPDEVQDTSEAVTAAQLYLSEWLTVPDSAGQELEAIDTTTNAYSWGNTAWRGFRALAAYAKDCATDWTGGGFWEWCKSGPPLGWPASTKKTSMSESETVQNSAKLSQKRIFEIDKAVSTTGRITMLSHLKVAEGGGDLAPRIYFYDDTGGPTQKMHVGLVGPHYLVPNKSTN